MEDLKKLNEFIEKRKQVDILSSVRVSRRQAAALMDCSEKTVHRYAKRCKAVYFYGMGNVRFYVLSDIKKMMLQKEYADVIRRFNKKFESGYYKEKK